MNEEPTAGELVADNAGEEARAVAPRDDVASVPQPPAASVDTEAPVDPLRVDVALTPFPGITIRPRERIVEFEGIACLESGWLEQMVCTPGTREHEALIVTEALPSHLHAALLMTGFVPGEPGHWNYDNNQVTVISPVGDAVEVLVRYLDANGEAVTEPIGLWVRDHLGRHDFPQRPWMFGGSRIVTLPERMGGGERYAADMSGSVIGLVTFGDEVLGCPEVIPDQTDVQPPEWEANGDRVPPPGTPVTVILRPATQ